MENILVIVIGLVLLLPWGAIFYLNTRINYLENIDDDGVVADEDTKFIMHTTSREISEKDKKLTDWETKQLKDFAYKYLEREHYMWVIHESRDSTRRLPVSRHELTRLSSKVNHLEEILLNPKKLEKEHEKMSIKLEIEKKQKELEDME